MNTYKFTGWERDGETGLDHTLFRQYISAPGRWMTPDPAGLAAVDLSNPQSLNRYAYVMNNPVNFIDPLGLCRVDITIEVRPEGASEPRYGPYIDCNGNPSSHGASSGSNHSPDPELVADDGGTESSNTAAANTVPDPNAQDPTKLPLCAEVFAKETLNNLNPFTPSASTLVPAATDVAARVQYNNIIKYALSRPNFMGGTGLMYPMKSSVVRGMLGSVKAIQGATLWLTLDVAMAQALFTELRAASKGECRAF